MGRPRKHLSDDFTTAKEYVRRSSQSMFTPAILQKIFRKGKKETLYNLVRVSVLGFISVITFILTFKNY